MRRRPVVSSLLLAIGLVGPAAAQPGPQPKLQIPWSSSADVIAVNGCVYEVRHNMKKPRFDAHISVRGKIRWAGTEEQVLLFKECLQQRGQSLEFETK
jgi:hypothetical protein